MVKVWWMKTTPDISTTKILAIRRQVWSMWWDLGAKATLTLPEWTCLDWVCPRLSLMVSCIHISRFVFFSGKCPNNLQLYLKCGSPEDRKGNLLFFRRKLIWWCQVLHQTWHGSNSIRNKEASVCLHLYPECEGRSDTMLLCWSAVGRQWINTNIVVCVALYWHNDTHPLPSSSFSCCTVGMHLLQYFRKVTETSTSWSSEKLWTCTPQYVHSILESRRCAGKPTML